MWSNCLFWALGQWFRHGGYLVIRRTRDARVPWFPHFMWMAKKGSPVLGFQPTHPWQLGKDWLIFFKGEVRHETFSEEKPNQPNRMTLKATIELLNEADEPEADVTLNIYNLEGVEASETLKDAVEALAGALGDFDAETGDKA